MTGNVLLNQIRERNSRRSDRPAHFSLNAALLCTDALCLSSWSIKLLTSSKAVIPLKKLFVWRQEIPVIKHPHTHAYTHTHAHSQSLKANKSCLYVFRSSNKVHPQSVEVLHQPRSKWQLLKMIDKCWGLTKHWGWGQPTNALLVSGRRGRGDFSVRL